LLGITVEGKSTFEIVDSWRESNDLCIGEVNIRRHDSLDADPVDVGDEFSEYVELLRSLVRHPAVESLTEDIQFDDLREISWRLSELLPVSNKEKQTLLELDDPLTRLEQVELFMAALNK
jgi:Lon protease-like protein